MDNDIDVIDESQIPPEMVKKVKQLTSEVRASRAHFEDDFTRMQEDARYHYGIQWQGQMSLRGEFRYLANIVQRFVRTKTDALYAKDPTFVAQRKPRMDFMLWDESMDTLQQIEMRAQTGMITPEDLMVLQDIAQGLEARKLYDRMGVTMELLMGHFLSEQTPSFKAEMKRFVRRAIVMGVSYVKLGFQRVAVTAEIREPRLADAREQIQHLERLVEEMNHEGCDPERAELEELRAMLAAYEGQEQKMREGLVFDFPGPTTIIPDMQTTALAGWRGSRFVAEQFIWPKSRLQEKFKVNVGTHFTPYVKTSTGILQEDQRYHNYMKLQGEMGVEDPLVCWWYVYDKRSGLVYTIADGYNAYLSEPTPPEVRVEQFFPIYPFMVNDVESEDKIFPPSDVRILRSPQDEYNRKREAARQHRIANRPLYVMAAENAEKEDIEAVSSDYPDHSIIKLKGLSGTGKVGDLFQMLVKAPITAELYEVESDFSDMQRVGGTPSPVIGELSGATATENSIAESSRTDSNASNIDDLEAVLNAIARDGSITLLREMGFDAVKEIVGIGAAWPTFTGDEQARELFLQIEAGSTGRPNSAQKVALIERLSALIVQLPGISTEKLARYVLRQMDPDINLTDWYNANTPSIQAINAMAKGAGALPGAGGGAPGTGNPETDPSQQGAAGGQNMEKGAGRPGGSQPAFPAPTMSPV